MRILATFHRHMANHYVPLYLTELFPQAARSEAKTCCPLIKAFRAFFYHSFNVKMPSHSVLKRKTVAMAASTQISSAAASVYNH